MKIKFSLFNFEYNNNNATKKTNKKIPKTAILETFFISLSVAVFIELVKLLISYL